MGLSRKHLYAGLVVVSLGLLPCAASAGVSDILIRAGEWWGARAIDGGATASDVPPSPATELAPSGGARAGMCSVPQSPPVMVCETGTGFLCLNTPPGGVVGEKLRIRGTIDRAGSVVASIRIAVQNEYTKAVEYVDTTNPDNSNCWGDAGFTRSFCLDAQGYFSAEVPLPRTGPYTIAISASRVSGGSVTRNVRTSRVVPFEFGKGNVAFKPDVTSVQGISEPMVEVTATLIGECSFCDFIGASTGGVTVTVENNIRDAEGRTRSISCSTNVEEGGQGRYRIGIPAFPGENSIKVRACNAAFGRGACPEVGWITFTSAGRQGSFMHITPQPQPSYDSAKFSVINWSFSMGGRDGCVNVAFNRDAPLEVCPDGAGVYNLELHPRDGINVATIGTVAGSEDRAWTFGWGRLHSPFAEGANGAVKRASAMNLALPARTIEDIIFPLANNFLASDEFKDALSSIELGGDDNDDGNDGRDEGSRGLVPGCEGGGLGETKMKLRGAPALGSAVLDGLKFSRGKMDFRLVVKDVRVGIDLVAKDISLPLVIAFRKAILNLELAEGRDTDGLRALLVTSPDDDCAFKKGYYCKHMPAPLLPQNFVGGANTWGGFVICDEDAASEDAKDACNAINSINAQTGVVGEKVIDAVNSALYCGGSALLMGMMRSGKELAPIRVGGGIVPAVDVPATIFLEDDFAISEAGFVFDMAVSVGNEEMKGRVPGAYRLSENGVIFLHDGRNDPPVFSVVAGRDIGAELSLDAVNAFLFGAAIQGDGRSSRGPLDVDLTEKFFNDMGFDFVEKCDKFEPFPGVKENRDTLCYVRPQLAELLGSSLSEYGYFPQKQPLLMAVRGNRVLAPRVSVVDIASMPVVVREAQISGASSGEADVPTGDLLELQIGGLGLWFYALEVDDTMPADEDGNLPVKTGNDGNPVIHSMRPEEADPWNGPVIGFDVTLLLGFEVSPVQMDHDDEKRSFIKLRTLAERSRLVVTEIEGSNSTLVPAELLIPSLSEKLKLAIKGLSTADKAVKIPVPREFTLGRGAEEGQFGKLGLYEISVGPDGLGLDFDPVKNSVSLSIEVGITQFLHMAGVEQTFSR